MLNEEDSNIYIVPDRCLWLLAHWPVYYYHPDLSALENHYQGLYREDGILDNPYRGGFSTRNSVHDETGRAGTGTQCVAVFRLHGSDLKQDLMTANSIHIFHAGTDCRK